MHLIAFFYQTRRIGSDTIISMPTVPITILKAIIISVIPNIHSMHQLQYADKLNVQLLS
jgi:hypothetical protein